MPCSDARLDRLNVAGCTWATRGDPQPRLVFQPVSEPKAGKVRIHLDVTVEDVEAAISEVTALGGSYTGERHVYDEGMVVVMADPEDHEFCLVSTFSYSMRISQRRWRTRRAHRARAYPGCAVLAGRQSP